MELSRDPGSLFSLLALEGGPVLAGGGNLSSALGVETGSWQVWEKRLVAQPTTCRPFSGVVASLSLAPEASACVADWPYYLFSWPVLSPALQRSLGLSGCRNWHRSEAH